MTRLELRQTEDPILCETRDEMIEFYPLAGRLFIGRPPLRFEKPGGFLGTARREQVVEIEIGKILEASSDTLLQARKIFSYILQQIAERIGSNETD